MAGLRLVMCFILIAETSAGFLVALHPVETGNFSEEGIATIKDVSFATIIMDMDKEPATYSVTVTVDVDVDTLTVSLQSDKQNLTGVVRDTQGGSGGPNKVQDFFFKSAVLLNATNRNTMSAREGGVLTGDIKATFRCVSVPKDLCHDDHPANNLLFRETREMNVFFSHDVKPSGSSYSVTVTVSRSLATVGDLTVRVSLTPNPITPDDKDLHGLSLDVVLKADQLNKEAVFDSVPAGEYTVSVQCGPGLCESLKQWINFTESATVIAHKSFAYYQQRSYNLTIKNDKLTDEKKDLQADKALLAIEAECLKCKLGWGTVCDMIKEQCGCTLEADLEKGTITYDPSVDGDHLGLGTVATYTCNEGFVLVGEANRSCVDFSSGNSAEFNGTAPTCKPIECLEPTSPENGHVEYDPESQKPPYVAYYRCNEGFQLKGDENRTCSGVSADNSGEFTGEDPTCEAKIVCKPLPKLENGEISYSSGSKGPDYDPETVATYTCNKGYSLKPAEKETSKCDKSGKFDGTRPTCEQDATEATTTTATTAAAAAGYSRYMEVAVGGLIAVLVVSLLGYLLYHYRVQVKDWVCSNKNAISKLPRPSMTRGLRRFKGGRYTKLPRTMQEVLHQD